MKARLYILVLPGFFLFALDRLCKHLAYTSPHFSYYLIKPWLGWEYFENTGIAFSLPFPSVILLIITPIIALFLIFLTHKYFHATKPLAAMACTFIFFGAISNYIDRFMYSITIDYLRLFTAIINLADAMIVVGAILLILTELKGSYKQISG